MLSHTSMDPAFLPGTNCVQNLLKQERESKPSRNHPPYYGDSLHLQRRHLPQMIAAMHMTVAKTHLPEGLALVRLRPSLPRRRKSSISVHPIAKKKTEEEPARLKKYREQANPDRQRLRNDLNLDGMKAIVWSVPSRPQYKIYDSRPASSTETDQDAHTDHPFERSQHA
ncbi:hypothetical protein B5807_10164 [Epicoccum nigrum]|uniref:Uncharacterized protein n=1 Tax=Epicoccum nigrum TaxID=105696 RepID=A0A1Y2LN19_EPING|nr:hypothetical protein B5807_10164 [Epicoccum nigrum]